MGLLDDLMDVGKDVAEQQLGQLLQQLGQEGECSCWCSVVWYGVAEQQLGQLLQQLDQEGELRETVGGGRRSV